VVRKARHVDTIIVARDTASRLESDHIKLEARLAEQQLLVQISDSRAADLRKTMYAEVLCLMPDTAKLEDLATFLAGESRINSEARQAAKPLEAQLAQLNATMAEHEKTLATLWKFEGL
jgi:BMFP domain-containing protein YqiC